MEDESVLRLKRETIFSTRFGPTQLLQFGLDGLLTERNEKFSCDKIIFFIPGNPGNITLYSNFMRHIYDGSGIPVVGLSHYGHIIEGVDSAAKNDLEGQVAHKVSAILEMIPPTVKLVIVGHSIGCYMTLKVVKALEGKRDIVRGFLLFPAIERLAEAPNSMVVRRLFKLKYFLYAFLAVTGALLQPRWTKFIVEKFSSLFACLPDCVNEGIVELHHWRVARNIIDMAEDEFATVDKRDDTIIQSSIQKMTFLYASEDGWSSLLWYDSIQKDHSEGDFNLTSKAEHMFFHSESQSQDVAEFVIQKLLN